MKVNKKLSVIIVAKDAEELIADAISSVEFADEIVVIDSGSTDLTQDIAKRMGAKIFTLDSDDFSEIRNYGLQKVKGSWVLYIDTDERVSEELAISIKDVVSGKEDVRFFAFRLKRKNFYFEKFEWPYIEKLERLFKKKNLKGWYGKLHESAVLDGAIGIIDGFLLHYSHRDLSTMIEKTIVWSDIEAKLRFDANHPKMTWWRFPRVMLSAFFNSYIKQQGWKVGTTGIIESMYQSFSIFITYAKLWELQHKTKDE